MKNLMAIFFTLFLCINNALSQDPIITMTTQKKIGETYAFRLRAIDNDTTVVKVDFGNGVLTEFGVGSTLAALIKGTLAGPTLKVYGMGSKIKLIGCYSMEITSLDVSKDTALVSLLCYNNQLSSLDVSKNENLKALQCQNNKFTFATLPLPKATWNYTYYPQLKIELAKDYSTDDEVDLSNVLSINGINTSYTWKTEIGDNLTSGVDFSVYAGKTEFLKNQTDSVYCEMTNLNFPDLALKTSDIKVTKKITGAPLVSMTTTSKVGYGFFFEIEANTDTYIQVDFGNGSRKNINLLADETVLIDEKLTGQTVKIYGKEPEIVYFTCNNNNLTALDASKATSLKWLECKDNQLTELDVTDNEDLDYLDCKNNEIEKLEVKPEISALRCENNRLNFSTLPGVSIFTTFLYAPQKPVTIDANYSTSQVINLNKQLTVGNDTTVYVWKNKNGETLINGVDYAITLGKFVFIKPQPSGVYCEMKNAAFPLFKNAAVLKSTETTIAGSEVSLIRMKTSQTAGSAFSFILQANVDNTPVKVDFGDGNLVAKNVNTNETEISGTLVKQPIVKIYSSGIIYLNCANNQITALDISQNNELVAIDCYKNQLSSIDVSKNAKLEYLECGENMLTKLDVSQNTALTMLFCYDNQITNLDLSKNEKLEYINFSRNKLSVIDITKNTKLTSFICDNNNLTALDISKNTALFNLTCENNKLTFATLPTRAVTFTEYRYAPQQPIVIAKNYAIGGNIDLSAQLSAGTATTVYKLKTKTGTSLLKDVDYSITDGKINFLTAQTDSVYCEVTNTTFPYLKGSDALKTSYTLVSTVSKQNQTITFNALPGKHLNDAAFELTASASSSLPVTFTSSDPTVASVTGNTVTILKVGSTTIMANQAGNDNWAPATASQTLTITPATGINQEKEYALSVYPNPVTDILHIQGKNIENLNVSIFNLSGMQVWEDVPKDQNINVSLLPAGIYLLKIINKEKENCIIRFVKQ